MGLDLRRILRGIWCVVCLSVNGFILFFAFHALGAMLQTKHWCGMLEKHNTLCMHGANNIGVMEFTSVALGALMALWLVLRQLKHLYRVLRKLHLPRVSSVPLELIITLLAIILCWLPLFYTFRDASI